MTWLLIIISAYFIFAITSLIDKYILTRHFQNPKIFAFYVGLGNILALTFVPFVNFSIPDFSQIFLSFFSGATFLFALYALYRALSAFEISRVVPAIGGILPLFTFGLTYIVFGGKEGLSSNELLAFFLLILGSVLVSLEKGKSITLRSLQMSAIAAFLLSLTFVSAKLVYLEQSFWSGFIWMRIGGFFTGVCFLFSTEVRKELFKTRSILRPKTYQTFFFNQGLGALAFLLQNWAIALAPIACVAVINALAGVQYAVLLIYTILISLIFPRWAERTGLKESITGKILFQKIFAILLVSSGLIILAIFNH